MNELLIILGVSIVLFSAYKIRLSNRYKQHSAQHQQWIEQQTFPQHLRQKVSEAHTDLSDEQLDLVIAGLRQFFMVCAANRHYNVLRQSRMPSRLVDAAWHAFILDSRPYTEFCEGAFGQYLHHVPDTQDVPSGTKEEAYANEETEDEALSHRRGLWYTWFYACELEGIDPIQPTKCPLLFSIDQQCVVGNGFYFVLPSTPIVIGDEYDPTDDIKKARRDFGRHVRFYPIGVLIMEFAFGPENIARVDGGRSDDSSCSSCGGD